MPRRMPRFDIGLLNQAASAVSIAVAGEIAHASGTPPIRREWSTSRLEALYELAYMRTFAAWEYCLESIFFRSLCGYSSAAGQELIAVNGGVYFRTIATAEAAVLGPRRSFLLWGTPNVVITRCQQHFRSGVGCPCQQEMVISSHLARLEHLASIRNRIVHDQNDARSKFDVAALSIAGRTYGGSRPGKLLRDWDSTTAPPRRWLETTIGELTALAAQMV